MIQQQQRKLKGKRTTLTLHLDSLRSPSGRGLVAQYSTERLAASFDLVAGRTPVLNKQLTCGSNGRSIGQSPKIELRTIKRRVPSLQRKIGREPGMFSFAEDQATATCCVAPRPSPTKSSLGTGREGSAMASPKKPRYGGCPKYEHPHCGNCSWLCGWVWLVYAKNM